MPAHNNSLIPNYVPNLRTVCGRTGVSARDQGAPSHRINNTFTVEFKDV